jgi:hypothetical protein
MPTIKSNRFGQPASSKSNKTLADQGRWNQLVKRWDAAGGGIPWVHKSKRVLGLTRKQAEKLLVFWKLHHPKEWKNFLEQSHQSFEGYKAMAHALSEQMGMKFREPEQPMKPYNFGRLMTPPKKKEEAK